MVCETLINKKLMYRLYAASRLTKICVLLLLILVKQMLDMASIESNKSSSFFLIGLSIWQSWRLWCISLTRGEKQSAF